MCKVGGGPNRCFAHKMGTKATVAMAVFMTSAPRDIVEKTSKSLKREGKHQPTPEQEEVDAFTMNQQFVARHDNRIPDNARPSLIRRWEQAREEKPDGGTMHSWRHTMVESVVRWKRTATAVVLSGSILATAACGAIPPNNNNNNSPAPSETVVTAPASPTASAPASPSASPTAKADSPVVKKLKANGIEVSDTVLKNQHGEYSPVKVADSNKKLTTLSKSHEGGLPNGWTQKDADASVKFSSNFLVQEVIDSPMNGESKQADAWIAKNKGKFTPEVATDLKNQLSEDHSFVMTEKWQETLAPYSTGNYRYLQEAGKPRIENLKVDLQTSYHTDNTMVYEYQADYSMSAEMDNSKYKQDTSLVFTIAVIKDSAGKFKIEGVNNSYDTVQPTKIS